MDVVRVNARILAVLGASTLSVVACVPPTEGSVSSCISDREVSELRQEAVPPAEAPTQAASGKTFYVRLGWGLLAGDEQARSATDWAGSLSVDQGTLHLSHLNFVEGGDHPTAQIDSNRVSWTSQTQHGFDGLVARVEVPSDDATLTFDTPSFHRQIRASELTGGDDAVFVHGRHRGRLGGSRQRLKHRQKSAFIALRQRRRQLRGDLVGREQRALLDLGEHDLVHRFS